MIDSNRLNMYECELEQYIQTTYNYRQNMNIVQFKS